MLMPSVFGNDLFDDFFEFPFYDDRYEKNAQKKLYGHRAANLMKTDIKDVEGGYEILVDLPGFKKEEVKASLDNGYLTISAAKMLEEGEKDKKTDKYLRRERYEGACQRSYYVGEYVTKEDLKAEFKDGVLRVFVPKKEAIPQKEEDKFISIEG